MPNIRECMTKNCHWVSPDTPLTEAAQIMARENLGFLPVGENDRLIGTITDRDIVIRALASGKHPEKTNVRHV